MTHSEEQGEEASRLFQKHKYNFVLVSSTNLDSIMEFYHNTPENLLFVCDLYQALIMITAMRDMERKGCFPKYRPSRQHRVVRVFGKTDSRWAWLHFLTGTDRSSTPCGTGIWEESMRIRICFGSSEEGLISLFTPLIMTGYGCFGTERGCHWTGCDGYGEERRMNKGIFWFLCFVDKDGDLAFTGEILTLLIPCDEEGNPKAAPSYNSKNGRSNTHKDSWITVTAGRKDLRGISWNYYPRGRVEISRGRALVFMNPLILNCEGCDEMSDASY